MKYDIIFYLINIPQDFKSKLGKQTKTQLNIFFKDICIQIMPQHYQLHIIVSSKYKT